MHREAAGATLLSHCLLLLWWWWCCSQLLSSVLLLLRLWDSGTMEMDNERSTQGTSAPLLPLLQRLHGIHSGKEEPTEEEEPEVRSPGHVTTNQGSTGALGALAAPLTEDR